MEEQRLQFGCSESDDEVITFCTTFAKRIWDSKGQTLVDSVKDKYSEVPFLCYHENSQEDDKVDFSDTWDNLIPYDLFEEDNIVKQKIPRIYPLDTYDPKTHNYDVEGHNWGIANQGKILAIASFGLGYDDRPIKLIKGK